MLIPKDFVMLKQESPASAPYTVAQSGPVGFFGPTIICHHSGLEVKQEHIEVHNLFFKT